MNLRRKIKIFRRFGGYITSLAKWLLRIEESRFERIIGLGIDDAGKGQVGVYA
jgi:hypothetical protein